MLWFGPLGQARPTLPPPPPDPEDEGVGEALGVLEEEEEDLGGGGGAAGRAAAAALGGGEGVGVEDAEELDGRCMQFWGLDAVRFLLAISP
jgi:hypothetical protein